jgi:hypothetical protein
MITEAEAARIALTSAYQDAVNRTRAEAAAPELLAALEAMLKHAEGTNTAFYGTGTTKALRAAFLGQKEIMQAARAALAKAKGVS